MQLKTFCPYLVGDVYITTGSHSPSTVWPGTSWQAIEGKFLLGADASHAAGSTGGAASHTLTIDEMPSHTHEQESHNHTQNAHTHVQNAHNHTQNAHAHTVNGGAVTNGVPAAGNHHHKYWYALLGFNAQNTGNMSGLHTSHGWTRDGNDIQDAGEHTHNLPNHTHTCANATPGINNTTATNQNTTATNNATTAVNKSTGGGRRFQRSRRTWPSTCGRGSRRARRRSANLRKGVA